MNFNISKYKVHFYERNEQYFLISLAITFLSLYIFQSGSKQVFMIQMGHGI
jgi:hypothetical protein